MDPIKSFKQEIPPMNHPAIMIGNHLVKDADQSNLGVFIIGDTHGFFKVFHELKKIGDPNIPMLFIHVGDFGFWPDHMDSYPTDFPWPVYFIDGNHDYYPWMREYKEITEVRNNLFFVPRGSTMEIKGKTFGFMGGAFSPDLVYRQKDVDWWPTEEEVSENDIQKLIGKKIDVLITHTPPTNVILRHFGPLNTDSWGLKPGTVDYSALRIEKLWGELGMPQMFCGHMHRTLQDGNCRILNINEVVRWEP